MKSLLQILCAAAMAANVTAAPGLINHQGRIAVNGVNVDGAAWFKFGLIDGTGATLWTNDGTGAGEPVTALSLNVSRGHYSLLLGESNPIPASIFATHEDVRLRIWFSADGSTFSLLSPDRRLTSAGYALSAATIAANYAKGSNADMVVGAVSAGGFLVSVNFPAAFAGTPQLALSDGWTVSALDEGGFSATASFAARTVDSAGQTGADASLAMIAGRPAIAYRSSSSGDLMFARAGDSQGSSWPAGAIVRVDGVLSDAGYYASLADVAGRPAIAYYDGTAGDLKFARALDEAGAAWPAQASIVRVDGAGENTGWHASLAVIGGLPAIAYHDPNSGKLRYARATNTEGSAWTTVTLTDGGEFASLAEINGKPAIAHGSGSVKFTVLTGSQPGVAGDWTTTVVHASSGSFASLAPVGGRPAIAFHNGTSLLYSRAGDTTGLTWPPAVEIDGTSNVSGQHCSLAEIAGAPAVAWHDSTAGTLIFSKAADAAATSWSDSLIVDGTAEVDANNTGRFASLVAANGAPAIAYQDAGAGDLKFASLPLANWTASTGGPLPILAEAVAAGSVGTDELSDDIGVWSKTPGGIVFSSGKVGIGRPAALNSLEVEGEASKTTAGNWLANSDRRIKTEITPVTGALEKLDQVQLVEFRYSDSYRAAHPAIADRRYLNVIAQDFAKAFPDDVKSSGEKLPDGSPVLQVDTYPLTIYSAAAVQELHRENQALKKQLADQEERLRRLEAALGR